jgi:hypothetical protein
MVNSLNEFATKYEEKSSSLRLDPTIIRLDTKTIRLLKEYGVGKPLLDVQCIQTKVDDIILDFLPALFNYEVIDTFGLEDISKLSLFGLETIEKDNVYKYLLAKMNGLIWHCDCSFGVLESKLEKLKFFLSCVPAAQPFYSIQNILDEMKESLILTKYLFQTQISPESVDLCTAWELSLSLVNLYSHANTRIHELVNSCIPETIDFCLEMLNFRSEFSLVKIRLIEIKEMTKHNKLNDTIQSL